MKATNINGTSDNKCKCGSWLAHWQKFSGVKQTYCSEKNCLNRELYGAHVQKAGSTDKHWFIIPLCAEHNKSNVDLDVGSTTFVSANKSETCDK